MRTYKDSALFELHFWLQVLGDHGRFLSESLAPKEKEFINQANNFTRAFDELLIRSKRNVTDEELARLLQEAYQSSLEIRKLKLTLLEKLLLKEVTIALPPTFINHMVNEVEEFIRLLKYYLENKVPPIEHPLHHDLLWLIDAAGHAGAINDRLDHTEKDLKLKSSIFTKQFEEFYLKAIEMAGYLRTNLSTFPALARFHHQIDLEMTIFKAFLREIEELELSKQTLSILSPLMADHMAREECYYLTKLAESTEVVRDPNCDPTKPRTKS
ncbi:DUF2935 domain-containing protein [Bacillus suaedaesalsae]|uniref:DUF2935 domain-containing protein n=1 Tax=Bacillus suaedaesalsae TaxID=2810349 RepID=UPI001EF5D40D|nr:DUF2935 domain-containing protein [Bacillus suaedaesalsae]